MAQTARDLINRSLRLIQVIGAGEVCTAEDASDGLLTLNEMLESWSLEPDTIFAETRLSFPLVSGTASYTIGTGGDFNTDRPVQITSAYYRRGSEDTPIAQLDSRQYAMLSRKSEAADPSAFYYDNNSPLGTIILDAVPGPGLTLHLDLLQPITTIAGIDTVLTFPPGYARALRYNLAIELAPEYERPVSSEVARIARVSKAAVMDGNTRNENNVAPGDITLMSISAGIYR